MTHMQDVRMLIGTAEPTALVPAMRFQRITVKIMLLVAVPIYVVGLIAAGVGLAHVARTGDWQHLWDALPGFARYVWLIVLLPSLGGWLLLPELRGALPALERAASIGDARLAPLAARQPEPSASPEPAGEPATFGLLRLSRDDLARSYEMGRWGLYGLVLVAALLAVELTVLAVLLGIATAETSAWVVQVALAVALAALLGVLIRASIALVRKARHCHQIAQRLRAGLRIQADADGLRWEEPRSGQERQLPWGEARAFYVIAAPAGWDWAVLTRRLRLGFGRDAAEPRPTVRLYALAGEHARLLWTAPVAGEAAAHAEHERLCQMIATRTRLPLRDLSTASVSLARAMRSAITGRTGTAEAQVELRALGLPPADLPLERVRRKTRRLSRFSAALLAPYLVIVLVGVVGSILQHVRVG